MAGLRRMLDELEISEREEASPREGPSHESEQPFVTVEGAADDLPDTGAADGEDEGLTDIVREDNAALQEMLANIDQRKRYKEVFGQYWAEGEQQSASGAAETEDKRVVSSFDEYLAIVDPRMPAKEWAPDFARGSGHYEAGAGDVAEDTQEVAARTGDP